MTEANFNEAVIAPLQHIEHRAARLLRVLGKGFGRALRNGHLLMQTFADELVLQDGHHKNGHQQRHHKHDGDGIREPQQEVVDNLVGREDEGEEGDADDKRSCENRSRKLTRGLHSRPPAPYPSI